SYNGGHVEFFAEVMSLLKREKADDIKVFGGGGGTITPEDARAMQRRGVDRIFFAGTPLEEIVKFIRREYAKPIRKRTTQSRDRKIAALLTELETGGKAAKSKTGRLPKVIGITGPGGA